jgi:hypothetical protein
MVKLEGTVRFLVEEDWVGSALAISGHKQALAFTKDK